MQRTSYIKKKIVCNCITKKCFFLVFEKNQDNSVMPSPTHSRHMPTFPDLLSVGSALFPWFLSLFAWLSVIIHCIIVQSLVQTDSHRNVCDRWLFRLDAHINTHTKKTPAQVRKTNPSFSICATLIFLS